MRFTYIEYHEGVVWNFSLTTIHLDLSRTYCASFFTVELLGVLISGFLINEYIFLRDFEITIATIGIVLISDKVLEGAVLLAWVFVLLLRGSFDNMIGQFGTLGDGFVEFCKVVLDFLHFFSEDLDSLWLILFLHTFNFTIKF